MIPDIEKLNMESCPDGLNVLGTKCCCESQCCWNNCRLDTPPANCVDVVDAFWVNDTAKGIYVAQVRTGKTNKEQNA